MKEILAIVRIDRINETKRALAAAGFPSVTARKVVGRGKGRVDYLIQNGEGAGFEEADATSERGAKLMPKRLLTLVVPDARKDLAVSTLLAANQTGKPGDGRIFVLPVLDALRVRSGEEGDAAVDEQNG